MDEIAATKLAAFSFPKADFRPKDITLSKNFQSNIKTLTRQQNTQLQYPNKQRELRRRLCKFWGKHSWKVVRKLSYSTIRDFISFYQNTKTSKTQNSQQTSKFGLGNNCLSW